MNLGSEKDDLQDIIENIQVEETLDAVKKVSEDIENIRVEDVLKKLKELHLR